MRKSRDRAITTAYDRGRVHGLRESLPFQGFGDVAPYRRVEPEYQAVIRYEKDLLGSLDEVYRRIHVAELGLAETEESLRQFVEAAGPDPSAAPHHEWLHRFGEFNRRRQQQRGLERHRAQVATVNRKLAATKGLHDLLLQELQIVRDWLDSLLRDAEAYAHRRPILRADPRPHPAPESVVVYDSIEAFVEERLARAISGWPNRKDADGSDYGNAWTWRDPDHPWILTRWRISYIQSLQEVYAYQLEPADNRDFGWMMNRAPIQRRVWLLKRRFSLPKEEGDIWRSAEEEYLARLERNLMGCNNSLLAAAGALAECAIIPDTRSGRIDDT